MTPEPERVSTPDLSASKVRGAVKTGRVAEILEQFRALSPVRKAELFVLLDLEDQMAFLSQAPPPLVASILADCDSASLGELLVRTDPASMSAALRQIPPDALADMVLRLPAEQADKILGVVDSSLRDDVRNLMTFDPNTAGGLMTPRYLSVPDVVTVERALEIIRSGGRADTPSYIYIVDANGRLAGVAPLRSLLMARPQDSVHSIMVRNVTRLKSSAALADIAAMFQQYHFVSLPVVDDKDRLVGIVTLSAMKEAQQRGQEQVLRGITGIDPHERFKQTLVAVRDRIPWITVTIVGGLGCAFIAGMFQHTLEAIVVLGAFMPVVLALGESIGAQTTSVVLATFAEGEGAPGELRVFLAKECLVGILVAIYSGLVVAASSLLWHGNPRLGLLIGGAVLISVAWAAFLAVVVPGLMKRFRVNPAIASGPLVLALADFSTLLVYFGGATVFMPNLK
ncbi:MAG TPA: magnesium transporter [Planctomycetota bacterium]|jgi:magnesium transporter|nr:magnesium transporter [Planctomycetota bacterium]